MPKTTLTTHDTGLLLEIADHLHRGGTHARGAALASDLHTLLQRHGRDVTVLSDEQVAQMQADIAAAEAAEALSTALSETADEASDRLLARPEQTATDDNRPEHDGIDDDQYYADAASAYITDWRRRMTAIGEGTDPTPRGRQIEQMADLLGAVVSALAATPPTRQALGDALRALALDMEVRA